MARPHNKGHITPGGIPSRIIDYLTANPGGHRAHEIATALDLDTQKVANIAGRLVRNGTIMRVSLLQEGKTRGLALFAVRGDTVKARR